jgi:hypothetical protein
VRTNGFTSTRKAEFRGRGRPARWGWLADAQVDLPVRLLYCFGSRQIPAKIRNSLLIGPLATLAALPSAMTRFQKTDSLFVRRARNGTSATRPLSGREMRELRRDQRESPSCVGLRTWRPAVSARFLLHDRAGSCRGRSGHQGPRPYAHVVPDEGHDSWAIQAYLGPEYSEHDALYRRGARPGLTNLSRLNVRFVE